MQSVIAVALLRMDDWWMTSRLKRCHSGGNKEMVDAVARPSCKLPLAAAFTPGAYKLRPPWRPLDLSASYSGSCGACVRHLAGDLSLVAVSYLTASLFRQFFSSTRLRSGTRLYLSLFRSALWWPTALSTADGGWHAMLPTREKLYELSRGILLPEHLIRKRFLASLQKSAGGV
jgi:hypothetical protein